MLPFDRPDNPTAIFYQCKLIGSCMRESDQLPSLPSSLSSAATPAGQPIRFQLWNTMDSKGAYWKGRQSWPSLALWTDRRAAAWKADFPYVDCMSASGLCELQKCPGHSPDFHTRHRCQGILGLVQIVWRGLCLDFSRRDPSFKIRDDIDARVETSDHASRCCSCYT